MLTLPGPGPQALVQAPLEGCAEGGVERAGVSVSNANMHVGVEVGLRPDSGIRIRSGPVVQRRGGGGGARINFCEFLCTFSPGLLPTSDKESEPPSPP